MEKPAMITVDSMFEKITKANKGLFRILKVGPDGGSLGGGCFPLHCSSVFLCPTAEGLVISCTVISYFIFTLTATWLQQTPEPDAKPITPWGALGRLVTSVKKKKKTASKFKRIFSLSRVSQAEFCCCNHINAGRKSFLILSTRLCSFCFRDKLFSVPSNTIPVWPESVCSFGSV